MLKLRVVGSATGGLSVVGSFRDTLTASAVELGYGPDVFLPLDAAAAEAVAAAVERAFGNAANGAMGEWWHSDRPCPMPTAAQCFHDGGWHYLLAVTPDPAAPVWFLTENWYRGRPLLFAFESTAEIVQAVLGNTFGFEYIVCGRQLDWLFAEDHHDCVSVAGAGAVERLQQSQRPKNGDRELLPTDN